jgi:hypothetical protein
MYRTLKLLAISNLFGEVEVERRRCGQDGMRLSIFFRDGLVCCARTADLWIRISCQEHDIKLFNENLILCKK